MLRTPDAVPEACGLKPEVFAKLRKIQLLRDYFTWMSGTGGAAMPLPM